MNIPEGPTAMYMPARLGSSGILLLINLVKYIVYMTRAMVQPRPWNMMPLIKMGMAASCG